MKIIEWLYNGEGQILLGFVIIGAGMTLITFGVLLVLSGLGVLDKT